MTRRGGEPAAGSGRRGRRAPSGAVRWAARLAGMAALALLAGALPAEAGAQEPGGPGWGFHVAAGVGAGGTDRGGGVALAGRVAAGRGPHLLLLRASGVVDPASESADPVGDLGLLYARAVAGRWGHALVAAGIARTSGVACRPPSGGACRDGPVPGVPVLGEVSLAPFGGVGLGLQAFVNLNGHQRFGGVALTLRLGTVPGR